MNWTKNSLTGKLEWLALQILGVQPWIGRKHQARNWKTTSICWSDRTSSLLSAVTKIWLPCRWYANQASILGNRSAILRNGIEKCCTLALKTLALLNTVRALADTNQILKALKYLPMNYLLLRFDWITHKSAEVHWNHYAPLARSSQLLVC
jgi:hypothetical protein